ncbi:MAG: hypothetical protein KDB27_07045, partial [Planctomycetales bacterium]|nr:hypothetical protein [Planctomycetales bacterium]
VLGSMGTPHKVKVGKVEVFLCCEGCKHGKVDKQHWETIAQNMKQAQAQCPVMEKPLPDNAKSTVVNGRLVFVCCPPCTKKIAASPDTFLDEIDNLYQASIDSKNARR